jgi:hypothetical protein
MFIKKLYKNMEQSKRESLLATKEEIEKKYSGKLDLQFDYEVNKFKANEFKDTDIGDEFVDRFYKCETISFFRRKWIKKLVSKNKIRLVNNEFDLDLMYDLYNI